MNSCPTCYCLIEKEIIRDCLASSQGHDQEKFYMKMHIEILNQLTAKYKMDWKKIHKLYCKSSNTQNKGRRKPTASSLRNHYYNNRETPPNFRRKFSKQEDFSLMSSMGLYFFCCCLSRRPLELVITNDDLEGSSSTRTPLLSISERRRISPSQPTRIKRDLHFHSESI
jgi:hypothetical protein